MTVGSQARVVFVSYAHEDVVVRKRLEVVLKPLVRIGRLELWADPAIGVARRWSDEIEQHLDRAELAVLLVSADFLASDYITEVELPKLATRGVPLVCVPVGPCGWEEHEELAAVQWALPPERPIAAMSRDGRDAALMGVFRDLKELATELDAAASGCDGGGPARARRDTEPLAASSPGELLAMPELPPTYLPRDDELDAVKQRLLSSSETGLVGRSLSAGLQGRGGVGKSVLAAAVCHDPEVRAWFPEGLCWVALGESPDIVARQRELAARFGDDATFSTPREGAAALRRLFEARRCLLVVDDVWSTAAAEAFAVTGTAGRVLYTTREAAVLEDVGADAVTVDVLRPEAALAYLRHAAGPIGASTRGLFARAVGESGRSMLALSLVAGVVNSGRGWNDVGSELQALAKVFRDHPYADVFKAMRLAVTNLRTAEAERYRLLGVFAEDDDIPASTIARLWDVEDAAPALSRLAGSGLLVFEHDHARFHDLQRAFVLFDADGSRALAHRQLLDAHRPARGWSWLPDDEPYLWDRLIYHLRLAGEYGELARVATDARWLVRRIHRDGPHPAEQDLARASAAITDTPEVRDALRMLQRWPGLFAAGQSLATTAATVVSRLPPAAEAVADLLGDCWLEPVRRLPEPAPALLRTLVGHLGLVSGVAFASDGRTLASAGADGTIRTWDPRSGLQERVVVVDAGGLNGLAFAPDGATIAAACDDGSVRLCDTLAAPAIASLDGMGQYVNAVAYAPDGRFLAASDGDEAVRIWDPATGKLLHVLGGHRLFASAIAFAPDSTMLAATTGKGDVRMWDPSSGTLLWESAAHDEAAGGAAFAPDGQTLVTVGDDARIITWDIATRQARSAVSSHGEPITAVAFAGDGSSSATSSWDGTVRLRDARSGKTVRVLTGHAGWVMAVAFSPDGQIVATGGHDGTVRLWDATLAPASHGASHRGERIDALALMPDGTTLVTSGFDAGPQLWDAATGRHRGTFIGHDSPVTALAVGRRGAVIATVDWFGTVLLWDPADAEPTGEIAAGPQRPTALALTADERTLATADESGTVAIWDATTRERRTTFACGDDIRAMAFSPDGRILAIANFEHDVSLLDVNDPAGPRAVLADADRVGALAFSPDGLSLVSGDARGAVRLWDVAARRERLAFHTRDGAIDAVEVSPDGSKIAATSRAGALGLWSVMTGAELAALRLGGSAVGVGFGPHGDVIATAVDSDIVLVRIRRSA